MSLNILIVDDSDVIRAMIARTLRLAKVPVGSLMEASNGKEALDVLEDEWVDLVLADINMPIMNGADMIERMRTRPELADVPVIVVSSEGATQRVSDLMGQGVTTWIRKPFTPEEIRDAVLGLTTGMVNQPERVADMDDVIVPVFETFAFMLPEVCRPADLPRPEDEIYSSTLSFAGAASGVLTVSAPAELCVDLAANVLGSDPDDPDSRLRGADALGEIVNIAAGHLVSQLEPHKPSELRPPVVSKMSLSDWEWQRESVPASAYIVEGLPILATLRLRPGRTVS